MYNMIHVITFHYKNSFFIRRTFSVYIEKYFILYFLLPKNKLALVKIQMIKDISMVMY